MAHEHPGSLLVLLLLLAGCPSDDDFLGGDDDTTAADDDDATGDDDDATPGDRVDIDWGVVDSCDVTASPGFGDWYGADSGILVYGSSPEDEALAAQVYDWYREYVTDLETRSYDELTEDDRQRNLFVVGHLATNPLLEELNGALPVYFEEEGFTFGGYRWDGAANGVALIHPSPFAEDAWLLLYVGNSVDGSYATFTIWTGARDYEAVRSGWTLQLEGDLCRDGDVWGYYAPWADDLRAEWEAWVEGLEHTEAANHTFHYPPGTLAAQDIDAIAEYQEAAYQDLLDVLEVSGLDLPIDTYLYPTNETKGDVTGNDGNAHAIPMNYEVHAVYGPDVVAIGAHEDVHVVAYHRIGDTGYALMGEGLAVMVEYQWWGQSLDYWASEYLAEGDLPPLTALIDDFWGYDDGVTYPVAGHFAGFVRDRWGIDTLKALYVADDLEASFVVELGLTTAELEVQWLDTIE